MREKSRLKKVYGRFASFDKGIQLASNQGIKCPDKMGNLMWANTSVPGYVIQNSVSIKVKHSHKNIYGSTTKSWCFPSSGVSRVWQAWLVPRAPLRSGRKNCLA